MKLKTAFIIALSLSIISLIIWEVYWRSQGYYPTINDDKDLWAMHRQDVEKATQEDYIIIGSSRAYFDLQIEAFKNNIGKTPIQLSSPGSSPLPLFHDIVNNTNFDGTIILGITPGLFFSTTYPGAPPWRRAQSKVDYYKDRTYAQRLNHRLSIPLQTNLALMSADEEEWSDDIDLKSLIRRIKIGDRNGESQIPPFNSFGDVDVDRNMRLNSKTETDTAFANSVIRVWHFFGKGAPPPDKENTMNYFLNDLNTFKSRGGNLILVRCPSSGITRMGENKGLPRADFWNDLVKQANVKAYHFEDYDTLKDLTCPEESHLSGSDADYFTTELIKIMKADNALPHLKIN